ncbi:MAG: S1C family serine protease [Candidatus Doudnabacteria bacterium]|nr:S1C family serine protease [bacterium]MDZ4243501.1 S1C family serine protease [Candidatus Doudnabacteria bacterium]
METPVNYRKIFLAILLVMLLGGLGNALLNRIVFPYLSAISILRNIPFFEPQAPIVITRREEVRINEGINNTDVVNQTKGSLASIFIHQGEFGTPRFSLSQVATGVVAASDGLIIVPATGIRPGFLVTAILSDGKPYRASVLALDQFTGVAFIQVDAGGLSVIRQGFSRDVNVGEKLLAVWTNEGPANVSAIQVSATSRALALPSFETIYDESEPNAFLSLDRGFSEGLGAVLVNKDGVLVGLVTKIGEDTTVLRSEDLKSALDNFLDDKKISWPNIELVYQILGREQTNLLKFPKEYGILIKSASAGLREGDFVYAVDGTVLDLDDDFQSVILGKKPGTKVNLSIIRGGQEREVELSL